MTTAVSSPHWPLSTDYVIIVMYLSLACYFIIIAFAVPLGFVVLNFVCIASLNQWMQGAWRDLLYNHHPPGSCLGSKKTVQDQNVWTVTGNVPAPVGQIKSLLALIVWKCVTVQISALFDGFRFSCLCSQPSVISTLAGATWQVYSKQIYCRLFLLKMYSAAVNDLACFQLTIVSFHWPLATTYGCY